MICLFWDYLQYRRLRGRYGNGRGCLLPDLFDETIPNDVLALLKPADLIWMHSKRSIRSWLIMYYCHLPLSHVSMYLGDGKIAHATTGGVISHPIQDLFNRGYRFLPCKVLLGDRKKRELVRPAAEDWIGTPYSYRRAIVAWLYIVTGRNWGTFKSEFYLDFLVLYLFCAAVTPSPFSQLILSMAVVHLALISAFAMLWKFRPIPFHWRGISLNMYFAIRLDTPMLPIINRRGSLDDINPAEIIAAVRERE
jgi:hypothetical protein